MKLFLFFLFLLMCKGTFAQNSTWIYTSDIDNFWVAFDSIKKTNDQSKKLEFINELYINKGTKGLKAFMQTRNYNDTLYVRLIDQYKQFWNSIRPNTLSIKTKTNELHQGVERLKMLYPELKDAEMYFTIGGMRSAGTVKNNMVLIGAEMATGTPTTDVSEFTDDWLKNVFSKQSLDNIVGLNIHEYIHTQQTGYKSGVLSQCIREGACDFIAELVIEKPVDTQYLTYGKANAVAIKALFKQEMFTDHLENWLYNGSTKGEAADLGYYIGYEICKAYYSRSSDKKKAIKTIIELNYNDDNAVEDFIIESKFFTEKINKRKLLKDYEKKVPSIVKIQPFRNGSDDVDPELKDLKIVFSKPMDENALSISISERGKDFFPLTGVKGFDKDATTLLLSMDLKPNSEYEFVITNRKFKSKEGYKLKHENFLVKFKTK